jgi:hypothetical protein
MIVSRIQLKWVQEAEPPSCSSIFSISIPIFQYFTKSSIYDVCTKSPPVFFHQNSVNILVNPYGGYAGSMGIPSLRLHSVLLYYLIL